MNRFIHLLLISLLVMAPRLVAATVTAEEFEVTVDEQELFVSRYPAQGDQLIIWVAPGFGTQERAIGVSRELVKLGIETWHVDLSDSLFLPRNTSTMRKFDGRYIAGLIDIAHQQTGKTVTLLTRSYGALPVLRGARYWQQQHQRDKADYLSGAILFSPETYQVVPALGLEPVYSDIVYATNIPIMLYQAGKRSNRWQLPGLLARLEQGGASVFTRVQQGVTGTFYSGDTTSATLAALQAAPKNIATDLRLLGHVAVPKQVVDLPELDTLPVHGLDTGLKPYKGTSSPLALDLVNVAGDRIRREDYTGKVTVINFWASWCPPCVEEIPSLNNLRKAMQGESFELISVNYGESRQQVTEFLDKVNVDFPVLLDVTGQVSASWNVLVYPATFVIGPDGKFRYGVNGAIHWDSPEVIRKLKALLK